jgi:hypothetical protein
MKGALDYVRQQGFSKGFGTYLVVPDGYSYGRLALEKGTLGLLTETLGKLSLGRKAKAAVAGGLDGALESVHHELPPGLPTFE